MCKEHIICQISKFINKCPDHQYAFDKHSCRHLRLFLDINILTIYILIYYIFEQASHYINTLPECYVYLFIYRNICKHFFSVLSSVESLSKLNI